jgi:hypothetical protein
MFTVIFNGKKYQALRGKFLGDVPKSYGKSTGVVRRHNGSNYASGLVSVFSTSNGLRYETYFDGSIFPMYGILTEVV